MDHYDSLRLVYDYLDDDFLFIVDDWNWQIVRDVTNKIIKELNIEILSKIEIFTAKIINYHASLIDNIVTGIMVMFCSPVKND